MSCWHLRALGYDMAGWQRGGGGGGGYDRTAGRLLAAKCGEAMQLSMHSTRPRSGSGKRIERVGNEVAWRCLVVYQA